MDNSDETRPTFHLAIPCQDLDTVELFYLEVLGCSRGRRHDKHVIFDFFGHQLVCHRSPEDVTEEPEMYPRHFGIVFEEESNYEETLARLKRMDVDFFREPFERLKGKPGEHRSFFVSDPANNLLEFKYYSNLAHIY